MDSAESIETVENAMNCFDGSNMFWLSDKELYICETALSDFRSILSTVGGDSECKRAELLLSRVTVIPDAVSPRIAELQVSAKIKERAKVKIFAYVTNQEITITM